MAVQVLGGVTTIGHRVVMAALAVARPKIMGSQMVAPLFKTTTAALPSHMEIVAVRHGVITALKLAVAVAVQELKVDKHGPELGKQGTQVLAALAELSLLVDPTFY